MVQENIMTEPNLSGNHFLKKEAKDHEYATVLFCWNESNREPDTFEGGQYRRTDLPTMFFTGSGPLKRECFGLRPFFQIHSKDMRAGYIDKSGALITTFFRKIVKTLNNISALIMHTSI